MGERLPPGTTRVELPGRKLMEGRGGLDIGVAWHPKTEGKYTFSTDTSMN